VVTQAGRGTPGLYYNVNKQEQEKRMHPATRADGEERTEWTDLLMRGKWPSVDGTRGRRRRRGFNSHSEGGQEWSVAGH